jgi:Mitochondrial K+-H+ exchange-related
MIPFPPLPPSSLAHGSKPDGLRFQWSGPQGNHGEFSNQAGDPSVGTARAASSSTPTMDVYLIPTITADQYEIYYEAPDTDDSLDAGESRGPIRRLRERFSEMLREAEEWRHRRHEAEAASTGFTARMRRKVMGFVVERIAEQRLLWHLRRAVAVCAQIPSDLGEQEAHAIIRSQLKKDLDHHFKWIWIDFALLVLVAPLMVIPGPNVPGFYFTFQVVGHFLSYRGAKQGLTAVTWTIRQNPALTELRALLHEAPSHRMHRVHEVAARLRLQHLARFFEQVAAGA